MVQKKLKFLRKEKGLYQKDMAKILSTDISSYSRKENGKSKIYDDEWQRLAKALEVSVDEIKEDYSGIVHPDSVVDNLQDYIRILKQENESLKNELEKFKP